MVRAPIRLALAGTLALAGGCIATFLGRGRGTPAPFDPPRTFVASGPYRWVRNPMYLGAAAAILGAGLVVGSPAIVLLAPAFLLLMHVIVITIDCIRWQEFYGVSDRENFKSDLNGSGGEQERRIWSDNASYRRSQLLPFMWGNIAKQGQIFGDPSVDSV